MSKSSENLSKYLINGRNIYCKYKGEKVSICIYFSACEKNNDVAVQNQNTHGTIVQEMDNI